MKKIAILIAVVWATIFVAKGLMAPNDPAFPQQTAITTIKVQPVWDGWETGGPTKIAVIGSGLGFTSTAIADIPGTVVVTSDAPDPYDDYLGSFGVSTHTSSICCALRNNGLEMAGIDDGATLQVYKAHRENHDSDLWPDAYVAAAVNDAVAWGAQVIQIEPTLTAPSPLTLIAVNNALFYDRIVVIGVASAASGVGYLPANAGPELIVVSATDEYGNPMGYDGQGPQVDLAAPGNHIWARANSQCCTYFSQNGTGPAFVTGVAGLLRDRLVGEWNTRRALLGGAHDLLPAGFDNDTGYGLLDAKCAFAIAGDMNESQSHSVDISDAQVIIALFGQPGGERKENVNGDNGIDLKDALIDLAIFGADCT